MAANAQVAVLETNEVIQDTESILSNKLSTTRDSHIQSTESPESIQQINFTKNHAHRTSSHSRTDSQPLTLLPQQVVPTSDAEVRLDGGFTAWSQVLVSFLLVFNGFGYFSAFGLFVSHWTDFLHATPSDIAWVGSIMLFLLFFLGILSGPLVDRGHFRSVVLVGCSFQIVGAFSTSDVTKYWQLVLAQGIVQGIGNGLLFTPCITLVSVYFIKKRAFALSLAACGAPMGGIIFPLV
jgi:hypothetical protein